jgi:toxin ParE1/3/4
MTYSVVLAERAMRDLAALFDEIDGAHSQAAARWYKGMKAVILSLEKMPGRCPAAPENARLRHLLYGRRPNLYRVLYRIVEKERRVEVLHIRHSRRQAMRRA